MNVFVSLLLGSLLAVLGQSFRIVTGLYKVSRRATVRGVPPSTLFDPKRMAIGLSASATVGIVTSAVLLAFGAFDLSPGTIVKLVLAGYVASDIIEAFVPQTHRGEANMGEFLVSVVYSSGLKLDEFPRCALVFGNRREPIVFERPGEQTVRVTEEWNGEYNAVRVLFSIGFSPKSLPVRAFARIREPIKIHLELFERNRMVGTVYGRRSAALSAASVEEGCDIACIPPTEQESGPGRCVICTDPDGTLELCC
jgi:hypothetical protein